MNGGLLGGLGVQPLKTQRMFNTPYGTTITIPPNSFTPPAPGSNTSVPFDQPGFQIKDAATNRRAFYISPDNSTGGRTIAFQSRVSPTGSIVWQGSDRTSTITFNTYIGANVYFNSVYYSSTTIGGLRFSAYNGNVTVNHFSLWDDGQATSDVMAQRNSTAAQAFRLYNTFTSLTNYERFTIDWQTKPSTCVIGTSANSLSGTRGMEFRVGANTLMTLASANNNISLFSNNQTYNGGSQIMFISNATAAPTASPVNGGYMFVSAGALRYMGSSGTITTIAPA
jgi:hypothetical protein